MFKDSSARFYTKIKDGLRKIACERYRDLSEEKKQITRILSRTI